MARIKITNATIKAKLTKWAQGQERVDELIYFGNEINELEWKQQAWDLGNMIVSFTDDATSAVSGFHVIKFVEKL